MAETATGDFDLLCADQSGPNLEVEERRTLNDVRRTSRLGNDGCPKVRSQACERGLAGMVARAAHNIRRCCCSECSSVVSCPCRPSHPVWLRYTEAARSWVSVHSAFEAE